MTPHSLARAGTFPGRLVVLEGTDGVGRSTQAAFLMQWLEARGYAVVNTGLRRSDLAGAGIDRAKRGNTLDPLTLNLLYATDFADRLERNVIPALRAGMVALVDRWVYSLIARAVVRGVSPDWMANLYTFAPVPDLVIYLDIDIPTLLPRVIQSTGFDYWESGQDFLPEANVLDSFLHYQGLLLAEFRTLAEHHHFTTLDARRPIHQVFADVCAAVDPVLTTMARAR